MNLKSRLTNLLYTVKGWISNKGKAFWEWLVDKITLVPLSKPAWGFWPYNFRFSHWKSTAIILFTVFSVLFLYSYYISIRPNIEWFPARTVDIIHHDESIDVVGYRTINTLESIIDILLTKPGGYISNDVLPPYVFLDNMPSWEFGALSMVREATIATRRHYTRSQTQSVEDKDAVLAQTHINIDNKNWILPPVDNDLPLLKGEYQTAKEHLHNLKMRLLDDNPEDVTFYARAESLADSLDMYNKLLGSYSQRLSAASGKTTRSNDGKVEYVKTPWLEIDDVFYESMGGAWALCEILKAIEHDFSKVLKDKNAEVPLRQVITELEMAQRPVYSFVILNGSGYGVFANHSLVLANYLSRASAALTDLTYLLRNG